ncbi:MAG: radical SAM family heme chaperone HemW [Flavobacteriaceae bacterium]
MAGLYIHIPFCKKACHYCNFHFSTSDKNRQAVLKSICLELEMRAQELQSMPVASIYFGGGTPSMLNDDELGAIFQVIEANYQVLPSAEITLEANPDDLSLKKITQLAVTPINRLSIGVQSFFEADLKLMNRAHTAKEALESLKIAQTYFDNITIDLLYGMPEMSNVRWEENLQIAFDLKLNHLSCYALTVEPKTPLAHFIKTAQHPPLNDAVAAQHFQTLVNATAKAGFTHYEVCSFGKPGYFSKHNSSYWLGKPYLGVGPSAHSFDGKKRSWNVSNNKQYINTIAKNELPLTSELLTPENRFNEYIMTGLRTIWGVSLKRIEEEFGLGVQISLLNNAHGYLASKTLKIEDAHLKMTPKGQFLSDGIASDLFIV